MPGPDMKCTKCNGAMEEGFIVDHSYGARLQSGWVGGPPETSMWTGVKLKGKEQHAVVTYRCGRCGYLESYAPGNS